MTQDTSRSIEELLREHAQKIRRSTRNGWIAIAVLVIVLSTWLTWLHGQVSRFDATAVADLAEAKARAALPEAAAHIQQRLEDAAPELIGKVSDKVLESPALLREHMLDAADTWLQDMSTEVAQALSELPLESGDAVVADMDARYPGVAREEQMHLLLKDFAHQTRMRVSSVLTGPADIYGGTLAQIEHEIRRLRHPEGLSKRELLHREILVTALQLAKYDGSEEL